MQFTKLILVATIVVFFTASRPLRAGLIDWSYTSNYASASNPNLAASFIGGGGHGAGGSWIAWMNYEGQSNNEAGAGHFFIGYAIPQWGNAALDSPPTFDRNFNLTLTLTDSASHASGSLVYSGYFVADTLFGPVTMQYTSPSEQSLILGGNRYDVTLPFNGGAEYADVQVAAVLPTPEPASIGMLLFAFGGLFLARRKLTSRQTIPVCN
jgi:hypothetical protein